MTEMGGAGSGSAQAGPERDHARAQVPETSEMPGTETSGESGLGTRDPGEIGPAEPVDAGSPPADSGMAPGTDQAGIAEPGRGGPGEPGEDGPAQPGDDGLAERSEAAADAAVLPAEPGELGPAESDEGAGRGAEAPGGDQQEPSDTQPAQDLESAAENDPAADQTTGTGTESRDLTRNDVPATYPSDYVRFSGQPAEVAGPHESPESWADGINPDKDAPGRDNNCAECSRAAQSTWEGKPATAAAMSEENAPGEPVGRMEDWAGETPRQSSMSQIGQRLDDLGPGSSAIVGCDWVGGGGHWFNAVNDNGAIRAVDAQSGETEAWPPSADGLGYDESDMRYSDAIFFDANGKVVK